MRTLFVALCLLTAAAAFAADLEGTFLLDGKDAGLKHVRAQREALDDKGTKGYAVLLTERKADGAIADWRTAEPRERGSFLYVIFEPNGAIWVAELGHKNAKSGRFGVVMELQKVAFEVKDNRVKAHVRTAREESFGEDRFTIDLKFDAPIEK